MAKKYVGDAAIGRAIKSLNGALTGPNGINNRVQDIAVSIVEHAAGPGNGDVSRALDLCKTVARSRTLNVAYLVGWFAYFGNANVNLRGNDGAGKVSLVSRDSKRYRGFDVEGARANNWFDAFNEKGERSPWYAGPQPAEYQPMTIGDLSERMTNFVKNMTKTLDGTKTVNGKEVPLVKLDEGDKLRFQSAMQAVTVLANSLARHEEVNELAQKLANAQAAAENDDEKFAGIREVLQQPKEQAVA